MHSKGVFKGIKSQKVLQRVKKECKKSFKEKLSQKRSGKILHGGFLHSQLSPVRREMRLPGGGWPGETPGPLLFAYRLIANPKDIGYADINVMVTPPGGS